MEDAETLEKLEYLDETKQQIKTALNDLGAGITDNDTFRSYVTKINDLYAEYPTEEQLQSIQLQNIQLQNVQPQMLNQPTVLDEEIQSTLEQNILDATIQDEEVE